MRNRIICWALLCLLFGCNEGNTPTTKQSQGDLFELRDNEAVGIEFSNDLTYTAAFNVYKYRNFYNGGGVAIGDINNDGLADVYMTSNQGPNRLFLNQGDWQFEDITETAGIGGTRAWSTGVTMVDINADGLLDIYVCNSGDVAGDNKENELYINQGDLTFKEQAAEYNLNDKGFSTHASFFDYDKDGDLDAYILNNSFQAIGSFNLRKNERPVRDELGGDKLMQNQDGRFVDVSEEAGIYGSVIGFGLGVTIGDVNNDNWEDIFVSNDFFERDYLYLNNQDGTFKEDLTNQILSTSGASMGADMGDINNDGYQDIFVTEMLPSEYQRLKTVTTFEDWDRYQLNVTNGYHHQFTRNVMHLNRGNNSFSEVGRLAGVEASDWSWGALLFDMDNDGYKDLFIANGIYKDLTNQDYLQYIANESVIQAIITDQGVDYKELIDIIPSNKVANHAYKNGGDLVFEEYTNSGLLAPSFSNGSAYGDLDNDGDLDLVVNNVNMPCFVYENKRASGNYIKLKLVGEGPNPFAIGSKVHISAGDQAWVAENQPTRGFQSSMDPTVLVGVGDAEQLDITVTWPDGRVTTQAGVAVNQQLTLNVAEAQPAGPNAVGATPALFREVAGLNYEHEENFYIDFNRERLVYHAHSTEGPRVATGDVNGDGTTDMIIPGPKGAPCTLHLGTGNGGFSVQVLDNISKDPEHVAAHLFDADADGDLDLYLASGGVEITGFSGLYQDQLFFNDGQGNFSEPSQIFSNEQKMSTLAVDSGDIDGDGDLDLFVGERIKVGRYGERCSGFILENDGQGGFKDVTAQYYAGLTDLGMITDAKFADLNGDQQPDLVVVGEFTEVHILLNDGGKFTRAELPFANAGWWNTVHVVDVDGDQDLDLIVGNLGNNSRFEGGADHPLKLFYSDFDQNSFPECILTFNAEDGKDYPYALRHNLTKQLRYLQKKYPDFESFKNADMTQIFEEQQLNDAVVTEANELNSILLINQGDRQFEKQLLPVEVQFSPMYAIAAADVDQDGDQDLLLGGNLYKVQPEVGMYDASYGHCLINDGAGNFTDRSVELGFSVPGEIRDIQIIDGTIYVFRNDDEVVTYQTNYE
ncbi:MAG: VCBS repeat-containing protein [Bacteroidota bacterium]